MQQERPRAAKYINFFFKERKEKLALATAGKLAHTTIWAFYPESAVAHLPTLPPACREGSYGVRAALGKDVTAGERGIRCKQAAQEPKDAELSKRDWARLRSLWPPPAAVWTRETKPFQAGSSGWVPRRQF